jgi:hypothetical protein
MMIIQDSGVLAIPTVPGPPPKLLTEATSLEVFVLELLACCQLLEYLDSARLCVCICLFVFEA